MTAADPVPWKAILAAAAVADAARRELRAALRAKVEAMRDEWQRYLDSDPTELERGRAWSRVDTLNGVLALIDEDQEPAR